MNQWLFYQKQQPLHLGKPAENAWFDISRKISV
jgi:hypothetical protein